MTKPSTHPSPGRDDTGALVRTFTAVPSVDGVLISDMIAPITADAGELHLLRAGKTVATTTLTTPTACSRHPPSPGPRPAIRLFADGARRTA